MSSDDYEVRQRWSKLGLQAVFGKDAASKRKAARNLSALVSKHKRIIEVFWLLDLSRSVATAQPASSTSGLRSAFHAYGRSSIYPVILPMWQRPDWRDPNSRELLWQAMGPFAHEPYTTRLLGNGTHCAVLDITGVFLVDPARVFDARQGRLLSDLIGDLRSLIEVGGVRDLPADEAQPFLKSSPSGVHVYAQLRRAAAHVWKYNLEHHRRCLGCEGNLVRSSGGNPSVTCDKPKCRRLYERRKKNLQRLEARVVEMDART